MQCTRGHCTRSVPMQFTLTSHVKHSHSSAVGAAAYCVVTVSPSSAIRVTFMPRLRPSGDRHLLSACAPADSGCCCGLLVSQQEKLGVKLPDVLECTEGHTSGQRESEEMQSMVSSYVAAHYPRMNVRVALHCESRLVVQIPSYPCASVTKHSVTSESLLLATRKHGHRFEG